MDIDKLLASLDANAERAQPAVVVNVPDVGDFYVRPVTVAEWEKLDQAEGSAVAAGLARALCDEKGERLPKEVAEKFADRLAKQPTAVMHALLAGMRRTDAASGAVPGN